MNLDMAGSNKMNRDDNHIKQEIKTDRIRQQAARKVIEK